METTSFRNGGYVTYVIAMFDDQAVNTQCFEAPLDFRFTQRRQNVAVKSLVQPIFLPDFVAG